MIQHLPYRGWPNRCRLANGRLLRVGTRRPFEARAGSAGGDLPVGKPFAGLPPSLALPAGRDGDPGVDLEAALRAVPMLVRDHLRPDGQGDYQAFEATLSVSSQGGDVTVRAVHPGGHLALERRAVHSDDWRLFEEHEDSDDELPVIDRRMMEGLMSQLGADLGAEEAVAEPKLREAQELMYQAWEESNPATRLVLAHKALAVSPDCADAYV